MTHPDNGKRALEDILSSVKDDELLSTVMRSNSTSTTRSSIQPISSTSSLEAGDAIQQGVLLSPSRASILNNVNRRISFRSTTSTRNSVVRSSRSRSIVEQSPQDAVSINQSNETTPSDGISLETLNRTSACKEYISDRYTRLLRDDTTYNPLLVVRWKESVRRKSLTLSNRVNRRDKCIWNVKNDDYFQFQRQLSHDQVSEKPKLSKESTVTKIDKGRILLNEFLATDVSTPTILIQNESPLAVARPPELRLEIPVRAKPNLLLKDENPPSRENHVIKQAEVSADVNLSPIQERISLISPAGISITTSPTGPMIRSASPVKAVRPIQTIQSSEIVEPQPFESASSSPSLSSTNLSRPSQSLDREKLRSESIDYPNRAVDNSPQPSFLPTSRPTITKPRMVSDSNSFVGSSFRRSKVKRTGRIRQASSIMNASRPRQRQESVTHSKKQSSSFHDSIPANSPEYAIKLALDQQNKKLKLLMENMDQCLAESHAQKQAWETVVFAFIDTEEMVEWSLYFESTVKSQKQYLSEFAKWKLMNQQQEAMILTQRQKNEEEFEKLGLLRSKYDAFKVTRNQYRSRNTALHLFIYSVIEYLLLFTAYLVWFVHKIWSFLFG